MNVLKYTLFGTAMLLMYSASNAQITINHNYNDNGALIQTIADTVTVDYTLDEVGNRTQFDVTNAPNSVLPVTWQSFTAKPLESRESELRWATATESGTSYFVVLRAKDDSNFDSIGVVISVGNSSTTSTYKFIDERPVLGMNYYKLKQVDINGEYDYSKARTVYFSADEDQELLLFPNPTDVKLSILINGMNYSDEIEFLVYDMQGNVVQSGADFSNKQWQMDIPNLANGMYSLQVSYNDILLSERFVVQH